MQASDIMQRVLDLAARGRQTTQPNPMVGCIIVKSDEIIAEGYHHLAGGLHAERAALKQAGDAARGATLYLNLEPCCHQGKTPPCTDALIDAGIAKIVVAMRDPNPLVEGGGFEQLKNAGIDIEVGILEKQAKWLNRGFVTRMLHNKPWVILKSAATLDGRIAAQDGTSQWITGEQARAEVQQLRASCSAVMTGIGTVIADNPRMNVRLDNTERQPWRVVLDSQLRIPNTAKIIADDERCVVFTLSDDQTKINQLADLGVEVVQLDSSSVGHELDLQQVLRELAKWECNEVLLESGAYLGGAYLNAKLVDELKLFYGGSILGDLALPMMTFPAAIPFASRPEFSIRSCEMIGQDVQISAVNQSSLDSLYNPKRHV